MQINAGKAAHALKLVEIMVHAGVTCGEPALHEVAAQHAFACIGTAASAYHAIQGSMTRSSAT